MIVLDDLEIPKDERRAVMKEIREFTMNEVPYLALVASLSSSRVVFLKNLNRELAVLPLLRRIGLWSVGVTLALAAVLGTLFAGRLVRPVGSLAAAFTYD